MCPSLCRVWSSTAYLLRTCLWEELGVRDLLAFGSQRMPVCEEVVTLKMGPTWGLVCPCTKERVHPFPGRPGRATWKSGLALFATLELLSFLEYGGWALIGLLGSQEEKHNGKQFCKREKGHLPWSQA